MRQHGNEKENLALFCYSLVLVHRTSPTAYVDATGGERMHFQVSTFKAPMTCSDHVGTQTLAYATLFLFKFIPVINYYTA